MQRTEGGGIVISCDFCGTDWDEVLPMIEGHRGSVLCLKCLKQALSQSEPSSTPFDCTICLNNRDANEDRWRAAVPVPSAGLNPQAAICWGCVKQAAGRFAKDPEVDFTWKPNPPRHP